MSIPQSPPEDAPGPDLCAGRKVTETHKALLWKLLNDDPTSPSRLVLQAIAETPAQMAVSLRPINRVRKAGGFNRGKGRPRRVDGQKNRGAARGRSSVSRLFCRLLACMYLPRGGNTMGV
jgi:hypothetical protein